MNIRLLQIIMMLGATIFCCRAETLYRLGFCDGRITTDGVTVEGATDIEAAILLTADDLGRFKGDAFAGVNAGLTSKLNANTLTVWVRETLEGENLAETTISINTSQKPRDGWNNIKFETPVDIKEATPYYVGYTLHQTKTSSLVAHVDTPHSGASLMKIADGEWTETDNGAFCIEALISGDNLPKTDLTLLSAELTEYSYLVPDRPFGISFELRNAGIETVYSYVLTVSVAGTAISESRAMTGSLAYGVSRRFTETFNLPGIEPTDDLTLLVSLSKPNGLADETPDNNEIEISGIPVIARTFPRTVLLEEFTTEKCSNCPGAAEALHEILESFTQEERDRLAIVCHHSGFYTDDFTLPCDNSYLWFFNKFNPAGQLETFAPAFMIDRTQAYDDSPTPVFQFLSESLLLDKITSARETPALYSIEMDGNYDLNTRQVSVNVKGECALNVMEQPTITVYLVENDVPATNGGMGQAGSGGQPYVHQHVIRAYNAIWGELPEWDGDTYSYSCTLEYPEGCITDNMQLIAFIANFDPENPVGCEVGNTTWDSFVNLEDAAVNLVTSDYTGIETLYDLSGRKVATQHPAPGIYVARTADTSRKIIIR